MSDWGNMAGIINHTGLTLLHQYGNDLDQVLFEAPTSLRNSDLNAQVTLFD